MNVTRIGELVARMSLEEIQDALWFVDVCERWNMPRKEADAWRLRILARQWFLELDGGATADA